MDVIFKRSVSIIGHPMRICLGLILILVAATAANSQDKCVSNERIATLLDQLRDVSNVHINEALKTEILTIKKEMSAEAIASLAEKSGRSKVNKGAEKPVDPAANAAKRSERICQI